MTVSKEWPKKKKKKIVPSPVVEAPASEETQVKETPNTSQLELKADDHAVVAPKAKKSESKSSTNKKKKKKKSLGNSNNKNLEGDEDDVVLDALIAEKKDGTCHFSGCKVVTSLISVYTTCRHCGFAHCTSHALAEIHGCGDKAKAAARKGSRF